jgi:hypothetical protein
MGLLSGFVSLVDEMARRLDDLEASINARMDAGANDGNQGFLERRGRGKVEESSDLGLKKE